jgi:hypothetical protein
MTAIEHLDKQVKQACPNVHGVSIRQWNDKTTWRITGPVTSAEQDAAQMIFQAFDKAVFDASQIPAKTVEERLTALEAR